MAKIRQEKEKELGMKSKHDMFEMQFQGSWKLCVNAKEGFT
jgi:hypothetical protein